MDLQDLSKPLLGGGHALFCTFSYRGEERFFFFLKEVRVTGRAGWAPTGSLSSTHLYKISQLG